MPQFQDLSGQRFGRWTVLSRAQDYRRGIPQWLCRCDCGETGVVRAGILKAGTSRSCGCFNRDDKRRICLARNTTHGMSKSPTHRAWVSMIARCHSPGASGFHKYGARGVTVCDRWRGSFEAFLADMGKCPPGMTLDRIDNAIGYAPGNCRWATQREQQNNRTNNRRITLGDTTLTLAQWSERVGVGRHTIDRRLSRGWPIEKALSPVVHGRSGRPIAR